MVGARFKEITHTHDKEQMIRTNLTAKNTKSIEVCVLLIIKCKPQSNESTSKRNL